MIFEILHKKLGRCKHCGVPVVDHLGSLAHLIEVGTGYTLRYCTSNRRLGARGANINKYQKAELGLFKDYYNAAKAVNS